MPTSSTSARKSGEIFAVLAGDLVGGRRRARPRSETGAALAGAFEAADRAFPGAFATAHDLVAADAWRRLCVRPAVALRAALHLRAEVKARIGAHGLDTRVAVGVGTVELTPAGGVAPGAGAAFRRAARALETLPRMRRLALRLEDRPLGPGFEEMLGLMDEVARRWTDRQALAVTGALQGWTQERIAGRWGRLAGGAVSQKTVTQQTVTQQTVAQHLQRAGWHALAPALEFLEGLLA